jgi:hypothetical protein
MDVSQGIRVPRAGAHDRVRRATVAIRGGGGSAVLGASSRAPLQWCEGCGDRVPRVDAEGRCPLCQEIDARLDAHVASAMADLVERFAELAVCYLHPDDVRELVDGVVAESDGLPSGPRLREVYERSHRFVEARERRARERHGRG